MVFDLQNLNPQQYEAVINTEGPLLIIAGAGSGKTRVITYRIAYLLLEKGISSWNIFAATFTNKAAAEMRSRVCDLLAVNEIPHFSISTFHSLCAHILRVEAERVGLSRHFTICDENDQLSLIKLIIKTSGCSEKDFQPQFIKWLINQCKIRMLDFANVDELCDAVDSERYIEIMNAYQKSLRDSNAVDFGDLLLYVVKIFEEYPYVLENYQNRFHYVLVDEYQDTNLIQFNLVHFLSQKHRNICVVGDEDQSIYSWRGANIANLLEFQSVYPEAKLIRLEQNYRSTKTILDAAAGVIANNKERLGKNLRTDNPHGEKVKLLCVLSEIYEAAEIADEIKRLVRNNAYKYSDIAIFYRLNALSRVFEDEFRRSYIPYKIIGGMRFYDRREVKDVIAYLKVASNPHDSIALERIINVPKRGIGESTISKVREYAGEHNISLFQGLCEIANDEKNSKLRSIKIIREFIALVNQWQNSAASKSIRELAEQILYDIDYYTYLKKGNAIEEMDRRENVGELLTAITQFEISNPDATLFDYLEIVSLITSVDEYNRSEDFVSLMTIHCAKGLEFPVVFIVALEHPIFPSQRTIEETNSLEEERRLFYVAITRAREKLYLSRADSRKYYGKTNWNIPSLFINEIPQELIEEV